MLLSPGPGERFLDHVVPIPVRREPSGKPGHGCEVRPDPVGEVVGGVRRPFDPVGPG
jgi:hypothetical protein